ncbi:N-acyl-D-amino-acid deacylase family protein [Maribacter sp. HTCC2170]|uniref:N-acyl-D-amino-acid deacylase family protein n=1 Tax=Maribacter sp. (strain HTCC2170 / KCCM 42371) TaxID=313603 RepID=UPI00006BD33B|nr:amidohydrolase family protein [Maribacter sp. HTCC2170]EAR02601.1 amidohydrolase family protein [Maribacter sp. HTCC2170]
MLKSRSSQVWLLFIIPLFFSCKQAKEIDILIENGMVYNGVDSIPQMVSVGISGDKISFIGSNIGLKAKKVINAKGLIVSPGFIDPHTHSDRDLINAETSHNQPFLWQGVTTVALGNDGNSLYPISKYKPIHQKVGLGTNIVMFVGHGTIRKESMGDSDRDPTEVEMEQMKQLLQKEMDDGAIGISTGLFYKPGSYSKTDEVIELAKIVARNNGIYDTHLRDESTFSVGLIPAIKEAIEIGDKTNIPIHISHIKCLGVDVWEESDTIIGLIEEANEQGLRITANQYPYEASATSLQAAVVPRWAESGGKDSLFIRYKNSELKERILKDTKNNIIRRGGADKLLMVRAEDSTLVGNTLFEVANLMALSPEETVLEVLKENNIKVASFNMNTSDITNFMKQDWVVTGSDGGSGHPRKYGSFPRKYRKYVMEQKIIPLYQFINNSSSKTAEILQLPKRGKLIEGYFADIILFDSNSFTDKADYTNAYEYSHGIKYAIINGQLSIDNASYTQLKNGRILTHKK